MAIAPPNEDAFLREVDENLRRDRMIEAGKRYGRLTAGLIGVLLLALAAFLWWRSNQQKKADAASEQLVVALAPVATGGAPDAKALATLQQSARKGYLYSAKLASAAALQRANNAKGAIAQFDAIAADSAAPQAYRDLATLRSVSAGFDTLPPQQVIDRLKPLAVANSPWFPSAAELTAAAWIKANQPAKAGPLFAAIAKDVRAPATLRARVLAMATALGQTVDMTPGAAK